MKKSLMKKKTAIIIISYLTCAAVALGVIAYDNHRKAQMYSRYMSANYQHAFSELVTSMREIDTALQKSLYATSGPMASGICAEIFGKAMTAQMSLGVLPFSTTELEKTAAFVSKVGDYAFVLSRAAASDGGYSDEDRQNLRALSETAEILAQNLNQLQTDMSDGLLTLDELEKGTARADAAEENAIPDTVGSSMRLIEQEFPELPSLIYDGPFSEHISSMKPKLLEDTSEITEEEARAICADFLGARESRLTPMGNCEGAIPSYCFTATTSDGDVSIEVSRQGGKVISLLSSRIPERGTLGLREARAVAKRFLEKRGYASMTESYHIITENTVTFNFFYEQNGVLCYSDLVHVGVALDSGTVVGFESTGYVMSHCERELPEVQVDVEAARGTLPEGLTVESEALVLIPSSGGYETLCHEFVCGTEDDKDFIIYVNAVSGQQEKILILLEDESGALTI